MKKYAFISIIVILVLAAVSGLYFLHNNRLELKSGDVIPSSIEFFNASGAANKISDVKGKYKVVFYLDSKNEDCMKKLDCITKMIDLMSFEGISYLIAWEDRIPEEKIREAEIGLNYNYSLAGKASLSESKPDAFLIDENNKIMMITGYSYVSLINSIIELSGKKDMSYKAGEMILKNVAKSGGFIRKGNEKTLLMFMTSGCRTCKEGEDIVQENIDSMQKKINVITVRPDFDTKQEYDKYFEIDPQMIYFNIYASAQGLETSDRKYPLFVIINSDYSIEKLFTDVNEAIKYTLAL